MEYTKIGWINRNRILLNEQDILTIPLEKVADHLDIKERFISSGS